jgi:hypothetical protein
VRQNESIKRLEFIALHSIPVRYDGKDDGSTTSTARSSVSSISTATTIATTEECGKREDYEDLDPEQSEQEQPQSIEYVRLSIDTSSSSRTSSPTEEEDEVVSVGLGFQLSFPLKCISRESPAVSSVETQVHSAMFSPLPSPSRSPAAPPGLSSVTTTTTPVIYRPFLPLVEHMTRNNTFQEKQVESWSIQLNA